MKQLKPFQETGAQFLASRFHAACADEPGLGKTLQFIEATQKVNAKTVLVICPASVRTSWFEHVEEQCGHTRGWDIISYNAASSRAHLILREKYDVIGLDEVHFLKNLESQRTQAVFGKQGLARRARYKWCLSGTLAPNGRPIELYPMLKALAPAFSDMTYGLYANRYCGAYWDGRGLNVKGATRIDELSELLNDFMIRRTKREVFLNRKEPLVTQVPVALSASDLAAVRAAEDEIGGREARLSSSREHFSAMGDTSKLLHLLGSAMVPHIKAFVDDLLETVEKVVVFYHHRDVGHALWEAFYKDGLNPVIFQGGMDDAKKETAVRIFNSPNSRIFLGQRQSAGVGINGLQKLCSTVVIAEPPWVPGESEQLIDRLDRIGQEDDLVNCYVMYARGTLSEIVTKVHDRKEATSERLMGD